MNSLVYLEELLSKDINTDLTIVVHSPQQEYSIRMHKCFFMLNSGAFSGEGGLRLRFGDDEMHLDFTNAMARAFPKVVVLMYMFHRLGESRVTVEEMHNGLRLIGYPIDSNSSCCINDDLAAMILVAEQLQFDVILNQLWKHLHANTVMRTLSQYVHQDAQQADGGDAESPPRIRGIALDTFIKFIADHSSHVPPEQFEVLLDLSVAKDLFTVLKSRLNAQGLSDRVAAWLRRNFLPENFDWAKTLMQLSPQNVCVFIDGLMLFEPYDEQGQTKLLDYCAAHFDLVPKRDKLSLRFEHLLNLVQREVLGGVSEDDVFDVCQAYIERHRNVLSDAQMKWLWAVIRPQHLSNKRGGTVMRMAIEHFSVPLDVASFIYNEYSSARHETKLPRLRCVLPVSSNGWDDGVLTWLGKNKGTLSSYSTARLAIFVNFAQSKGVANTTFIARTASTFCCRNDFVGEYIEIQFKNIKVCPSHYAIRHDSVNRGFLRNWELVGVDESGETVLSKHDNDTSLNGPGKTACFAVHQTSTFFASFRLRMTGLNSDKLSEFRLHGFEVFGSVIDLS